MKQDNIEYSFNNRGFSLVEISIALAIVGILAVVIVPSFLAMGPTRNMNSDGRGLLTLIQRAKVEAIQRGECVAVRLNTGAAPPADLSGQPAANRGSFTLFLDDGAGVGGIACNAIMDGTEILIGLQQFVGEGVALTQAPVVATVPPAGDPNFNDLFESISFEARGLIPQLGRRWVGGRAIVLRNDPNPALATWWGRVIVSPSGSVSYQTNNNPATENTWSR